MDTPATTIECLDYERPIRKRESGTDGGVSSVVCADERCIRDPNYARIHFVRNRIALDGSAPDVPGLVKRCRPDALTLDFESNDEPEYVLFKDRRFGVSLLYAEVYLPSHVYRSVRDRETGKRRVDIVFPKTTDDLPHGYFGSADKLRVGSSRYDSLLDFCRYSIHTHVRDGTSKLNVCCKRLCSRPEALTKMELWKIKIAAATEPYYTCSWLEKRLLFKWHVGEERFEPYLSFDYAIGVYSGPIVRHDPFTTKPFAFRCWKTPDEDVPNADEIYFRSPINVAGYKWYEPTSTDRENEERYKSGGDAAAFDPVSERIAKYVMNLAQLPPATLLSSSLIVPCSFANGSRDLTGGQIVYDDAGR